MIARIRRLVPELPETAVALVVAAVVEVGLKVTTLPKLAGWLGVPLDTRGPGTAAETMSGPRTATLPARAALQVRATRRVLRHWPFGDTCLRQALISGQRLRRMHPALHVGVAKIDDEIKAHAWLVIHGVVLDPLRGAASYQDLIKPQAGAP